MRRTLLILTCGVWALTGLMVCSCGRTHEPPGPYAQTLGDTEYGTPIAKPHSDAGILQDQTQYRPASSAGDAERASAAPPAPGAAPEADASAAVRELVTNLLDDMESGEVELVVGAMAEAQIEALLEDYDFLYHTSELYERMTRLLADLDGDAAAEQLSKDLRALAVDSLKVDLIDANTATVTPNPLLIVFGPSKTPAALTAKKDAGDWKVRLDAPLTADDVAEITQYHEKLQEGLDALIEALDSDEIEGHQAVYRALVQIAQGRELDLAAIEQPEEEEAELDQPREAEEDEDSEDPNQP